MYVIINSYTVFSKIPSQSENIRITIMLHLNPFEHSVLFVEHRQTVHNQIRRRRVRRLIKFCTAYRMYFWLLNEIKTYRPTVLKFEMYCSN